MLGFQRTEAVYHRIYLPSRDSTFSRCSGCLYIHTNHQSTYCSFTLVPPQAFESFSLMTAFTEIEAHSDKLILSPSLSTCSFFPARGSTWTSVKWQRVTVFTLRILKNIWFRSRQDSCGGGDVTPPHNVSRIISRCIIWSISEFALFLSNCCLASKMAAECTGFILSLSILQSQYATGASVLFTSLTAASCLVGIGVYSRKQHVNSS